MLEMERSNDSGTTDDTTCSLLTLRAQAGKPLRDVILDIYAQRRRANNKATGFLTNLKCFLPAEAAGAHLPNCDVPKPLVKTLLRPCSPVEEYVALSYPWSPSYGESNTMDGYRLLERTVPVRNVVLDRTIRFIRYKQGSRGMIPFWIDKLSIEQDDTEHEKGMQYTMLYVQGVAYFSRNFLLDNNLVALSLL